MIAPSLLSADFSNLAKEVEMLNSSSCDLIHLDIMDGVFVPNISFGFPVIKSIKDKVKKPLDAHLMIVEPDKFIKNFAEAGVEYLSVHYEVCNHLNRTVQNIRSYGMKAGVAINPATPVSVLEDILGECDFIVVMSVNPGFAAQKYIDSIDKVRKLRKMIDSNGYNCLIEIDGGINRDNVEELSKAGVDIFVAGNAVFSAADPLAEISLLQSKCSR
ncbi:MAG: ribulose-phosphate 3-epimerase [Bacteroidales bacterium]|nr:ribulose-phosphate 3-epimerase [Bacteroidales bacterium]